MLHPLFLLSLGGSVAAVPSLFLSLSGPRTVVDVVNLRVDATVTNTGTESVKLLHDPRGVLSQVPTETFSVYSAAGSKPNFIGVKVKYVATVSRSSTVLSPGESVTIEHYLSRAYDFSEHSQYRVEASNLFHYVDADTEKVSTVLSESTSHNISLSGKLGTLHGRTAPSSPGSCSPSQTDDISAAAAVAVAYATASNEYLQKHNSSTLHYTNWFGSFTSVRHVQVLSHYTKMILHPYGNYTYDCSTCEQADTYAYVYPARFGTIYLCNLFWEAPLNGTDSKAGTLIHESSHFPQIAYTNDFVYGQTAAKALAISDPNEAVENADNHEYFAEHNPLLK
ncbi:peptidyl-Lys metalloendopeptidase [Mycena floridula]|nr:peptidyl-Lys metalloendopeptidase [Mycena floridula]